MSADGWNTLGINRLDRSRYLARANKFLGSIKKVLPNELRLIIAEYGSSLTIRFRKRNYLDIKCKFDDVVMDDEFDPLLHLFGELELRNIHKFATFLTEDNKKIDLLSNGKWHWRQFGNAEMISVTRMYPMLPRDAYVIIDRNNEVYTIKQSIDECTDDAWAVYVHNEEAFSVKFDFCQDSL